MKKLNVVLIISFLVCLLSLHHIRMRMFWFYILVIVIIDIKKYRRTAALCGCFCIAILMSHFYLINEGLDRFRFPILKSFYVKEAKDILTDEKALDEEDVPHKTGKIRSCLFFTYDHTYHLYKDRQAVSVYFPTTVNFFQSYGYVYCEDEFDVDDPIYSLRNDEALAIEHYDWAEVLDEHWAFIRVY